MRHIRTRTYKLTKIEKWLDILLLCSNKVFGQVHSTNGWLLNKNAARIEVNKLSPDNSRVIRHVSLGMYSRNLEPLATNSTNASVFPARWRNGRNCLAFGTSCAHAIHLTKHLTYFLATSHTHGLPRLTSHNGSTLG